MKKDREHFVTCGQMKILEKRADEDGLSYYRMMENAGTGAAKVILENIAYKKVMTDVSKGYAARRDAMVAEGVKKTGIVGGVGNTDESPNNDINDTNNTAAVNDKNATNGANENTVAKAFVFCGKGNNGGDGFVVARLLSEAGFGVRVILVDGYPKTADAITNFELLKDMPVQVTDMSADDGALLGLKGRPDIVVDAIYGTGFRGKLRGNGLKAAMYINSFSARGDADRMEVFALDIPSGLGGDLVDERELDINTVKADVTITFHAKKPVHLQGFAAEYCGRTVVADIGIDEERLWEVDY